MEQKIVLVPPHGMPKNFIPLASFSMVTMMLVIGILLAASYMGRLRRGLAFFIPDDFFTTVLFMTFFIMFLIFLVAVITANQELIWAHAPQQGEIRLEDWYYGTPVFIRRYPIKEVAGIRVWWQRTHSGSGRPVTDHPGWWKAALVLWNGKSIHLHSERGGPEHPPVDWLARFEHACRVSGVELKCEPVPQRAQPPIASIVNSLKRRQ